MARKKSFSNTWWGQQWIDVLESFGWANRLQRGRRYACNGSVLELNIEKGKIIARVQGSRHTPYKVTIKVSKLKKKQWQKVLKYLSTKALYAAKLLSGDMPEDIADMFLEVGVHLLPRNDNELDTKCSCPDFAVPCKHIAAVHYLIAEELDKDPFLVFKLRGMEKDEVLDHLLKYGDKKSKTQNNVDISSTDAGYPESLFPTVAPLSLCEISSTALPISLDNFWKAKPLPELNLPQAPSIHAVAFTNTENTFWDKNFPMAQIMQGIYRGSGKM
ncbi:MAG: SWIM zinc finger family protein [Tepidanaerobacteraceae bacterium]|nr:SWIM zinc finger family protein [Tepidanaerobacteraceae bacterium]